MSDQRLNEPVLQNPLMFFVVIEGGTRKSSYVQDEGTSNLLKCRIVISIPLRDTPA